MDTAGSAHDVAVRAATRGDDLPGALPELLRVSRDHVVLQRAVTRCDIHLARQPDDDVERRARELLVGALSTTVYRASLG
jgi:hypothetical protein